MALPTPRRISELDVAGPLTGAEQFVFDQNNRTVKGTIATVKEFTDTSCQCTIVSRYDTVATGANTLEKFFYTYTLPANTLLTNGSWLEIMASGTFNGNGNTKSISLYIGGIGIFTASGSYSSSVYWTLDVKYIRMTQTDQKYVYTFKTTAGSGTLDYYENASISGTLSDLAIDNQIAISGQNGTASANDIACESLIIRLNKLDADS